MSHIPPEGSGHSPPPYQQHGQPVFPQTSQNSASAEYNPVRFDDVGLDPQKFYGQLIDVSNRPSQLLCRMTDALFFYLDANCDQFRGTQCIEPAKIIWLNMTIGTTLDAETGRAMGNQFSALYDAASIPYTLNNTQTPVLDRRGYLHLAVFEVMVDPAVCHQQWNKILNVLTLHDPLTNLRFPTPIPSSAFPAVPHPPSRQLYIDWQIKLAQEVSRQRTQAQFTQTPSPFAPSNNGFTSLPATVPGGNNVMWEQLMQMRQTAQTAQTTQGAQALAQLGQMQQGVQNMQGLQNAQVLAQMQQGVQNMQALQNAQVLAQLARSQQVPLGTMPSGQTGPNANSSASDAQTQQRIDKVINIGVGLMSNLLGGGSGAGGQSIF